MKQRVTIETLYKFDELSEEAKERAVERLYDINVDYEWWDGVYDDAELIGCKIKGFDIGRGQSIDFQIFGHEHTANAILKNHGEVCETYQLAAAFLLSYKVADTNEDKYTAKLNDAPYDSEEESLYWAASEYWEERLKDLEEEFERELAEEYLSMLRREYEYLTSEEAIIETIQANEYDFTEDGQLA